MPELVMGWMSAAEKQWLAEQASTRKAIVEVGCWMGETTKAIADACSGTVYAVDTWQGSAEHKASLADKPHEFLFQAFIGNIGPRRNIAPLKMESLVAASYLKGEGIRLDMVFIDAAHDYESVKADILAWRAILAPGGLLCGHDFDAGRDGVVQAVRELLVNPRMAAGTIWYEQ